MSAAHHTWIYLAVTPNGLHWPGRNDCVDSLKFAKVPGRWLSDTEFETTDGEVLLVPPSGADGSREGPIEWRERASLEVDPRLVKMLESFPIRPQRAPPNVRRR